MFSIKRDFLAFVVGIVSLIFFTPFAHSGSALEWHKITNATGEPLQVHFYIGYPLNKTYSKKLEPGQYLEVKQNVEVMSNTFLLEVVGGGQDGRQIVLWKKLFDTKTLMEREKNDPGDGIVIRPEDLRT